MSMMMMLVLGCPISCTAFRDPPSCPRVDPRVNEPTPWTSKSPHSLKACRLYNYTNLIKRRDSFIHCSQNQFIQNNITSFKSSKRLRSARDVCSCDYESCLLWTVSCVDMIMKGVERTREEIKTHKSSHSTN